MKTTILISSIALMFGSILYLNKPTQAIGSGVAPSTRNNYTFTPECPVVGNGLNNKPQEFIPDEGGIIYEHCQDCNTGVYYKSDENIIKCTFCGKVKPE